MTGDTVCKVRDDHEQNKDEYILQPHKESVSGTVNLSKCRTSDQMKRSNTTVNSDKKSKSFVKQHRHDSKTQANRNVVTDDNKNPVVWTGNVSSEFPVHECVYKGDVRRLSSLIRTQNIAQKDMHGNTPLHLAVMLGHKECAHLLLAHSAPVKVKNALGWSPLAEAISYGDRQMIAALLRKLKQQSRESAESKRPQLLRALWELGDFYLELHWDFQSWVPLISRILPSDACKIYKQGINIRLDTTLVDFSDRKCRRGDLSFIFHGDAPPAEAFVVLDNEQKVYQRIRHEESEMDTEEEVDILMSSDIYSATLSTKNVSFSRSRVGWLFREDETEKVGKYVGDLYTVKGLVLECRKRREHLSEEDVLRNKAMVESLSRGSGLAEQSFEPAARPSLCAPETNTLSWEEYVSAEVGKPPPLGREQVCKESKRNFKATVAMSQDFPLSIQSLLNALEVIAPFKHFSKLREFVQMKLPPGFPVKLDIPVFPTITATVTFQEFRFDKFEESIFTIPADYKEDPYRFPDL